MSAKNPKTGRSIAVDGDTFKRLLKEGYTRKQLLGLKASREESKSNVGKNKEPKVSSYILEQTEAKIPSKISIPRLKLIKSESLENERIIENDDIVTVKELFDIIIHNKNNILDRMTDNLKELLKWKLERYADIYRNLAKQKDEMDQQIQESKLEGQRISSVFPMYDYMSTNINKIKQIHKNIKDRISELTVKTLQIDILDAITDKKKGIISLKGEARSHIRNMLAGQIYSLANSYKMFTDFFLNVLLLGGAGVGKTATATVMSFVFSKIGILATNNVIMTTRGDLVGQYIGQTAQKTLRQLFNSFEGILFIDEAYQITPCQDGQEKSDFGSESITEIVNFMDKYIGLNIIIAAGYPDKMKKCFLSSNEGLPRRFSYTYTLSNYSPQDLYGIFVNFVTNKLGDVFKNDDESYIYTMIRKLNATEPELFKSQAGDMLNLASILIRNFYNSKRKWIIDNFKNNKVLIDRTFIEFAKNKNFDLEL